MTSESFYGHAFYMCRDYPGNTASESRLIAMSVTNTSTSIIIAGGLSGNAASTGALSSLQVAYNNLLSGAADIVNASGTKVFTLGSAAISSAASWQIGLTETSGDVAANQTILQNIAAFCNANDIKIHVDANLTDPATWSSGSGAGHNELVDQWAQVAAEFGLPIDSVEDIQEVATSSAPSSFASIAAVEANSIKTLVSDYAGSSYDLEVSNLSVGDMEGGNSENVAWWEAYDAAATAVGVPTFSYATADTMWFGPWIYELSTPFWQTYLTKLSADAASQKMELNVVVQGAETSSDANQFAEQTEQNAADLGMLAATGKVTVSFISLQSWDEFPVGVGLLTSAGSLSNTAAEINATYSLYASGKITAVGSFAAQAPGQIVLKMGVTQSLGPVTLQWDAEDTASGGSAAIVIIDQTGLLSSVTVGSGSATNLAPNILVLTGNSVDLAAEVASVRISEKTPGPDVVDIELYTEQGRVADTQEEVVAFADGSQTATFAATTGGQGWLTASVNFNTGTVAAAGSVLTSETLNWANANTQGETIGVAGGSGQTNFVNVISVHDPLSEFGIENASSIVLGTTANAVVDIYNPAVDNGAYPSLGYANNAGVNNVVLTGLPGWLPSSFDAGAQFRPLTVASTIKSFDHASGILQSVTATIAPNSMTVVDQTGTRPDIFDSTFNTGGAQITEINTGDNLGWNQAWGNQFNSATLTYSGSGVLVELLLQGGAENPWFTIDNVFDPNTGHLWEQFQTTQPPSENAISGNYVGTNNPYQAGYATGPEYQTQFIGSPNFNYQDWGTSHTAVTEVWTDNFIMAATAGFVDSLSTSNGYLSTYTDQFVNGVNLDVLYLPGTTTVDLNNLSSITLASQTQTSDLNGITCIDALGSTGTVTLTGLHAGACTLIGGDDITHLTGYGHDTIMAGAGLTWITTGAGESVIQALASAGTISVTGDNNTISGVLGAEISLTGSGDSVSGSGLTVDALTNSSAITISSGNTLIATDANITLTPGSGRLYLLGSNDVVASASGCAIEIGAGTGEQISGSNLTIVADSQTSFTLAGTNNVIELNGTGATGSIPKGNVVAVNESSAGVVANLSVLQSLAASGVLASIVLTDGGTPVLSLTAAQIESSVGILAKISGAFTLSVSAPATGAEATAIATLTHVTGLTVADTAANIVMNLPALQTLAARGCLASIILISGSTPVLSLTAAQLAASTGVVAKISGAFALSASTPATAAQAGVIATLPHMTGLTVVDTATNIAANMSALCMSAANGALTSIHLSNGSTPVLSLTAAQLAASTGVVTKISGPFTLCVSTSATANQAAVISTLTHVTSLAIADTTASVINNLTALSTLASRGALTSVKLTDGDTTALNLTAVQMRASASVLAKINTVSTLYALGGGNFTMASNIANIHKIYLTTASNIYTLIANSTPGLIIQTSSSKATITVGASTQSVLGSTGSLRVMASAADAGALVHSGPGGVTLEITTGGNATLNSSDTNLTVILDAATNLTLDKMSFITAIASTQGSTITASAAAETLESLRGGDTLVGSLSFGDVFRGSVAGLSGDRIVNFGGSDFIDVSDLNFSNLKPITFNAMPGLLQATDGAHTLQLSLLGHYATSNFSTTNDGQGGTLIHYVK